MKDADHVDQKQLGMDTGKQKCKINKNEMKSPSGRGLKLTSNWAAIRQQKHDTERTLFH